jgi:hypothetical protein
MPMDMHGNDTIASPTSSTFNGHGSRHMDQCSQPGGRGDEQEGIACAFTRHVTQSQRAHGDPAIRENDGQERDPRIDVWRHAGEVSHRSEGNAERRRFQMPHGAQAEKLTCALHEQQHGQQCDKRRADDRDRMWPPAGEHHQTRCQGEQCIGRAPAVYARHGSPMQRTQNGDAHQAGHDQNAEQRDRAEHEVGADGKRKTSRDGRGTIQSVKAK